MREHAQRAEPQAQPKPEPKRDKLSSEAEEAGLTEEEFLAVKAAQARLWPLGQ